MASPVSGPRTSALRRRVGDGFRRRISVDLRALAVFRVGLAMLLLVNLGERSRHFRALHTDRGILPVEGLTQVYGAFHSVHAVVGEPWTQVLLFPVAGLFALALLVGYRTRVVTAVSFVLLILLHTRNPLVLNGGDVLLSSLLFWATFLPLGERYALDARRYDRGRRTVSSVGSLAILLQVLLVYVVNASHKVDSDIWMSGDAVIAILQAEQFTVFLGPVLSDMHGLLTAFNYLWMVLLLGSPLLLLLVGVPRAVLATLFAGMHLGMFLSMPIGLFPWVSVLGLVLFCQPVVWDALARIAARRGLESAAKRRTDWVEQRVPPPGRLRPETDSPGVETARNGLRFALPSVVPAVILVLILSSALGTTGIAEPLDPVEDAVSTVNMEQDWQMFAPNPVRTTKWYAAPANRTDGTTTDALHDRPAGVGRPTDVADSYRSFRWRKALDKVRTSERGIVRSYFANYLCERYNRTHTVGLQRVEVYYGYERTDPDNGAIEASGGWTLFEYDCRGPTIQTD